MRFGQSIFHKFHFDAVRVVEVQPSAGVVVALKVRCDAPLFESLSHEIEVVHDEAEVIQTDMLVVMCQRLARLCRLEHRQVAAVVADVSSGPLWIAGIPPPANFQAEQGGVELDRSVEIRDGEIHMLQEHGQLLISKVGAYENKPIIRICQAFAFEITGILLYHPGMVASSITAARRRVLMQLKQHGRLTATSLAERLGMTDVAARQHLGALRNDGFVDSELGRTPGPGRPATVWFLTDSADEVFPDRHAELTVGLIHATREGLGEDGLHKVVDALTSVQLEQYRASLPKPTASLKARVEALAARRTAEGYMAEVVQQKPGVYLLIEHHCPICEAARTCGGLCAAELTVFQGVLGEDIDIERTQHMLADADRCVYRIQRAKKTRTDINSS